MKPQPRFVNLCSHRVVIYTEDETLEIPPSGHTCLVSVAHIPLPKVGSIPVVDNRYGKVLGLPDPQEGVVFITSLLVRLALGNARPDVVAPDTSRNSKVVDERNKMQGVLRLVGACGITEGATA